MGLVLSFVGLLVMAIWTLRKGHFLAFLCCTVFCATMVLMYASSALYHSHVFSERKRMWQLIDHICIYLLIAGSYTPFAVLSLKGSWGWWLLTIIWSVAVAGIALKILMTHRYHLLEALLYLAMGWVAVFVIVPLYQSLPFSSFILLLAGGLSYSVGVIFYLRDDMPYNHAIWHLFVMGGSACHFFSVFFMLG
jgi:hemolysin III